MVHVLGKADVAAGFGDAIADIRGDGLAMGQAVGICLGQRQGLRVMHNAPFITRIETGFFDVCT